MGNILKLLKDYAEKGVLDLGHVLGVIHGNACEAEERIEQLEAKLITAEIAISKLMAAAAQKAPPAAPAKPSAPPTPETPPES